LSEIKENIPLFVNRPNVRKNSYIVLPVEKTSQCLISILMRFSRFNRLALGVGKTRPMVDAILMSGYCPTKIRKLQMNCEIFEMENCQLIDKLAPFVEQLTLRCLIIKINKAHLSGHLWSTVAKCVKLKRLRIDGYTASGNAFEDGLLKCLRTLKLRHFACSPELMQCFKNDKLYCACCYYYAFRNNEKLRSLSFFAGAAPEYGLRFDLGFLTENFMLQLVSRICGIVIDYRGQQWNVFREQHETSAMRVLQSLPINGYLEAHHKFDIEEADNELLTTIRLQQLSFNVRQMLRYYLKLSKQTNRVIYLNFLFDSKRCADFGVKKGIDALEKMTEYAGLKIERSNITLHSESVLDDHTRKIILNPFGKSAKRNGRIVLSHFGEGSEQGT
jgi:hypothetical protein